MILHYTPILWLRTRPFYKIVFPFEKVKFKRRVPPRVQPSFAPLGKRLTTSGHSCVVSEPGRLGVQFVKLAPFQGPVQNGRGLSRQPGVR